MATHTSITGAQTRTPFVRARSGARLRAAWPIPAHRRKAIEAEIELHLQRATVLIARLDGADAPTMDMEDDDPAGGAIDDEGEGEELLRTLPRYDVDQSRGPVNERGAIAAHTAAGMRLVRTERGWRRSG